MLERGSFLTLVNSPFERDRKSRLIAVKGGEKNLGVRDKKIVTEQ